LLQRVEVESLPGPHDQFTVEHAVDAQLGFESGLAADNSDAKAVPHFNS
jgi:hypothetical protein